MQKPKMLMFAALLAASVAIPLVAYADSADCSGAPHWNSDHNYKKGDRAWHHEGGNSYYLYSCDADKCHGAGDQEPSYSSKVWKFLGHCDKTPS